MDLVSKVDGSMFIDHTRISKSIDKIYKSDTKIIIEIASSALDVPYGDYFESKELWVVFGSERDPKYPLVQLKQYLQVKFNKSTMLKSQIEPRSENAIKTSLIKWKNYAQENGHFQKKKVPKVLPGKFDDLAPSESDQFQMPEEAGLIDFSPADKNHFDFTIKPEEDFQDGFGKKQDIFSKFGLTDLWDQLIPQKMRDFSAMPFDSLMDVTSIPLSLTLIVPVLFVMAFGLIGMTVPLVLYFLRLDELINYLIQSMGSGFKPQNGLKDYMDIPLQLFGNGQITDFTDDNQDF